MDLLNVTELVTTGYRFISSWVYDNPGWTDVIVGAGALGSLAFLIGRKAKARHRLHRIRWGKWMNRSRNREGYEKSLISYGICDAIEEAVYRGDMTRARADWWYHSFANNYNMTELLPVKDKASIKRGIKYRLNAGVHRVKAIIPGAKPGVKVDSTYKPVMVQTGLKQSKYSTAHAA